MADFRQELFNNFKTSLSTLELNQSQIQTISNCFLTVIDKYEITNRCTEIALKDNSLEAILKIYIASLITSGKSKKTAKGYTYIIKRFFDDTNKIIQDITGMDIMIWIAKQDVSLVTSKNYRNYLASFFTWCYKQKIIVDNPINQVDTIKSDNVIKQPFTKVEIDLIRSACTTFKQRAIIETLLSSGIRVDELCNLKIHDINFQTLEIMIRSGKGNKDRRVYINDVCNFYIQKYLSTRNDTSEFLFVTKLNTQYTTASIRKMMHKISKFSNVGDVHPHKFRHTFADTMIKNGMDIRTLQILMGHTNLNTTMRYLALNDKYTQIEYMKHSL